MMNHSQTPERLFLQTIESPNTLSPWLDYDQANQSPADRWIGLYGEKGEREVVRGELDVFWVDG